MPPDFWPSFERAFLLALLAVVLNRLLVPGLGGRRWLWVAILLPFLTPPLLTAYAYTKLFLHLTRWPWLEEAAYEALVFCRAYPLALLAAYLVPRRLSPEGAHVKRLLGRTAHWREFWHFFRHHVEPASMVAGLLVFLYAFHEFEMASLLQRPAWTVAVFDAQAQGYSLSATWARLGGVVVLQIALLGAVLRMVTANVGERWGAKAACHRGLEVYVSVAFLVMTLFPLLFILSDGVRGIPRLPEAFSMQAEVGQSLLAAGVAATLAYVVGKWVLKQPLRIAVLLLIPGLLGTLLLSLTLLTLIQWRPIEELRDRPVPLVLGLAFLVLPLMTVLLAVASRREQSEAGWCVRLSGTSRLIQNYFRFPHLAIWSVGFVLAYFEVTVSAILAPASMTPIMVRLYNLMHYGRDTMLSAYVLVVVAAPLAVVALAIALGHALGSRRA